MIKEIVQLRLPEWKVRRTFERAAVMEQGANESPAHFCVQSEREKVGMRIPDQADSTIETRSVCSCETGR